MKKTISFRRLLSSFFLLMGFSFFGNAQIIYSIAGTGSTAYSGDGIPASTAAINPERIAFDAVGNLYIADITNNRVRKITRDGIIHTFAGNGTAGFLGDGGQATAAELNYPYALIFDHSGNLYVTDYNNYRIRKVTPAGVITTIAGNGTEGLIGDGGPATDAELKYPNVIYADVAGNVFVGDNGSRIRKIDTFGIITTFAGTATFGYGGDGGPATAAQLKGPGGITEDTSGNMFIVDGLNNRIRMINTSGIINTIFGTGTPGFSLDGTPASAARFNEPDGLYLDNFGSFYFTDMANGRVRRIDAGGILYTVAGNGTLGYTGDGIPATATEIGSGTSFGMDCAGNLYFSDEANARVRMVAYNHAPAFTGGPAQTLTACEDTVSFSLSSLLSVTDEDTGQTETWSVVTTPAHGAISGTFDTVSTGGILLPTSLYYVPTGGYTGNDTFRIVVSDCMATDTTTVYVSIITCPLGIGTAPQTGLHVSVYPDPGIGDITLTLSSPQTEEAMVAITNITGEKVLELSTLTNASTPIRANFPSGMYFVTVTTKVNTEVTRMVICK